MGKARMKITTVVMRCSIQLRPVLAKQHTLAQCTGPSSHSENHTCTNCHGYRLDTFITFIFSRLANRRFTGYR